MSLFDPKPESHTDRLAAFIATAADDPVLLAWLRRLRDFSDNERLLEVSRFTEKMRAAHEDEELIKSVSLLRNRTICNAALSSIE
jgi:hypothetical protein